MAMKGREMHARKRSKRRESRKTDNEENRKRKKKVLNYLCIR